MALELLETVPPPVPPTEDESRQARETARQLESVLREGRPVRMQFVMDNQPSELMAIPAHALRLLANILAQMAQGNAVTLIPFHAELTTLQAANFLNVSRPFLIGLLDKGVIPYRRVGTHRRIPFRELLAYKQQTDARRDAALAELVAEGQELEMGY